MVGLFTPLNIGSAVVNDDRPFAAAPFVVKYLIVIIEPASGQTVSGNVVIEALATDNEEIAKVSEEYGAEIPIFRSKVVATFLLHLL